MIKILKNKFLICMFLLVVSVIITSSCYAMTVESADNLPFTVENIYSNTTLIEKFNTNCGYVPTIDNTDLVVYYANNQYYVLVIDGSTSASYMTNGGGNYSYGNLRSDSGGLVSGYRAILKGSGLSFYVAGTSTTFGEYLYSSNSKLYDCTTIPFYSGSSASTTLIYEPAVDTSFTYEFEGVKRGQCKLTINGLDSSLRMYGYVGLETYPDGDTLNPSFSIDNLRLLATKTDNSDLYCYLYDGEELFYYIVDENNKILDFGSITDMAKGDFLYGFNVSNGVDFVFLRDGVPYWDNSLTFKYNTNNSNTIQNNDIVSTGNYSYIETSKTVASGTYTGYVFDSSGNLVVQADCDYGNNLSSLSIEVDTSYYENHTILKHISCYWLQSITLTGTNSDGSFIDFSNYKVQWSVPTWVTFESIELGFEEYNMRSGTLTGFTSAGSLSMFNLQLYQNLSDYTRNFDITLQVYDGSGNLVLTHIVNSDNIVDNQIKSEENNVDKGDYDIVNKPGYTGGSNSNYGDIGNIQNWTTEDYINLMSTDNFVWEFFKAILGNLPWWITTPLTILIFGVVIITIIRFARGA